VGMDGLLFESASFPVNHGFRIVQKMPSGSSLLGFSDVSSIEDWTANEQEALNPIVKKAYWATRCQNNCETLNRALQQWLVGSGKDYVIVNSIEAIKISSLSTRQIGLTPHHVGTLVEPPFVSKIPPSPDGETYHLFLAGVLHGKMSKIYGLDCSCAQFGVFGGIDGDEPYIACELQHYLRKLGSHRILPRAEQSGLDPFVAGKVEACLAVIADYS
jgi:hypothetical protein